MLGRAFARCAVAWGELGSMLLSTEGSNLIRFRASRTALTSRSMSIVLNVGGWGRRSASVGAITPAGAARPTCMSYWIGTRSNTACSRRTRSDSALRSSDRGAGPSFKAPLDWLYAWAFVSLEVLPALWGIKDESSPVDSSHSLGAIDVGFVEVTMRPTRFSLLASRR